MEAQTKSQAAEILQEEKSQFGDTANQFIDYLKSGNFSWYFVENYSQQLDIQWHYWMKMDKKKL